jgi:hypothetical protein
MAVFCATLAFTLLEPFFFVGYLISIAIFGLYQAILMANAGDATVVGDIVGDPGFLNKPLDVLG